MRILPARMLLGYLARRPVRLSRGEIEKAHGLLADGAAPIAGWDGREGNGPRRSVAVVERRGSQRPLESTGRDSVSVMATTVPADRTEASRARRVPPARSGGGQLLPPGPRVPAIAQTLAWAVAPTWVMDRCARRLGGTFTLTFAPSGLKLVMVSDPEAVKAVFTAPPEVAPSAAGSSPVGPIMGPSSVIVLTGPEHMRQRKLLLPPVSR